MPNIRYCGKCGAIGSVRPVKTSLPFSEHDGPRPLETDLCLPCLEGFRTSIEPYFPTKIVNPRFVNRDMV
jgi:hypothetical protein